MTAEVDVRDYDALAAAVDRGVEQLGRLDIVVANAGIGNLGNRLHKIPENIWQDMIDVNLTGVWKTVKAGAAPDLRRPRWIDHHDQLGRRHKALAYTGHYIAAKHGVAGLMRTFASSSVST